MNKISVYSVALASALVVFSSCSKVEQLNQNEDVAALKPIVKSVSSCQADTYTTTNLSDASSNFQTFQKTFDQVTGKVNFIKAGIYSIMVSEYLEMNVHWQTNRVAFTSASNPSDTILIAKFDKKGLLLSIVHGNAPNENYLPTNFQYKAGRLSTMKVNFNGSQLVSNFTYDRNGNLKRIQELPFNGQDMGYVEYEYNTAVTASNQLYFDEPRGFNRNTFTLAEYMGWLPGLKPVNLRTHSKVVWEGGYQVHDVYYKNHVTDGSGNLTKYEVASSASDESYEKHEINWTCPVAGNTN